MSYSPKRVQKSGDKSVDEQKKQKITVIALIAMIVIVIGVVLLVVFRPFGGASGSNTDATSPLYPGGVIPTSGARHDVDIASNGGADAMELSGKWRLDQNTMYEFDGYGRGLLHTGVDNYSFAYSAQDGLLAIDFDTDNGRDSEYTYVIDGDSMTLTRGSATYDFTKEV